VPGGIVARETKRGTRFRGEDTVAVAFDPFHTHQFADRSFFIVNPLGTQFAHLSGGRGTKLEWEGAWRAAAKRDDRGWTAEMAIPWAILNYPATRAPAVVGINFDRYQQRTNTHSWWSNLGQFEDNTLDGHWQGVLLPRFRPFYSLLPYVVPRYGRTGSEDGGGRAGEDGRIRFGIDGRAALSPTLTLVGTINPDFENVEQAVESVDFSYGERFVPDRRPFFQEGQGVYEVGGIAGEFFYSARVPAFDTGLNLYGKLSPRDTIGLLAAYDAGNQTDWLLRGRREISESVGVDFALINRDARPGNPLPTDPSAPDPAPPASPRLRNNRVLVAGERWRINRSWDLNGSWAGSWVNGRRTGDTANAFLRYHNGGWFAQIAPHYVRPGFRDELGFIPFTDYKGVITDVSYNREERGGPFRFWYAGVGTNHSDRFDGRLFRRARNVNAGLRTRGSDLGLNVGWNGGRFASEEDVVFNDRVWNVSLRANASDPFHTYGLGYGAGRRAGAAYSLLTPFVTWRFGSNFTLGASSQILRHIQNREQHILTFAYDFSAREGLGGRIIVSDTPGRGTGDASGDGNAGGTSGYIAYRRSGYGGTETFLILGDPNARRNFAQRVALKIVWSL
jgi:hypothetical protein